MNYAEQLNTIEWKKLRNKILKRDNYECLKCNNKKLIQFSEQGTIIELVQIRTVLFLFNRSDPRFHPTYRVKFKTNHVDLLEDEIKSYYEYNSNQLKQFEGKKLFVSHNDYRKNGCQISCIPNHQKGNSWFFVNRLEVHHIKYLPNYQAWEHPEELLQTLCWICHKEIRS